MRQLQRMLFDIYALALPRGHGFGKSTPIDAFESDDSEAFGVITNHVETGKFGYIVLRRRVDFVWSQVTAESDLSTKSACIDLIRPYLKNDQPRVLLPTNTAPRPRLGVIGKKEPSDQFSVLATPSHQIAAWTLNQLYLSLPNPDKNWVSDCQTENFHTRMWEAQLLASFREQGLLVTQPHPSPDFEIQNRLGGVAHVEAVTTNPKVRSAHVNAPVSIQPDERDELFFGAATERFAKTIGNKLQREYHLKPHVAGKPLIIAIADFHAPGSMVWSREALIGYLYGTGAAAETINGRKRAVETRATHLLGKSAFPAGLFANPLQKELSAVIFSNACAISKLNRVPISAGAVDDDRRHVRVGRFFDRSPGALEGIPFCMDISSKEYKSLWPQRYEPWSAEMEVFHNPFALHPTPRELLPEATHWIEQQGEVNCESFYETSILWSRTLIQNKDDKMPKVEDFIPKTEAARD